MPKLKDMQIGVPCEVGVAFYAEAAISFLLHCRKLDGDGRKSFF